MRAPNASPTSLVDQPSTLQKFYGSIEAPLDRAPRAWPRYMTARVAADYSDTSRWTIRRHIRPCGRRGRTFVYAIEAIEEWMRGASFATLRERASVQQPKRRSTTKHRKDADVAGIRRAIVEDRNPRVTK